LTILTDTKNLAMRTCITALTLFATLFHFTVGCCGHLHAECEHGVEQSEPVGTCDRGCDHEHDHAHDVAAEPVRADDLTIAKSILPYGTDCPGHDGCHGCSCSATPSDRPLDLQGFDFLSVAWFAPTITPIQSAVSVAWEAADPPVRADVAPPLSERLLV